MIEIIKNDVINYESIYIPEGESIVSHLKQNTGWQFKLQRVSHAEFDRIKKAQEQDELLDCVDACPIVGYNPDVRGDYGFQSGGGLKFSSDRKDILGSFVIEEGRVIYTPISKFYEERDAFVYSRRDFYTTLSMPEILEQELVLGRQAFIYVGDEYKYLEYFPILESVSQSEMMEYAINPEKGKAVLQKIYRK